MWKRAVALCGGAAIALVIAGCSGGESSTGQSEAHGTSATSSAAASPSAGEHNDADVTFAQQMIPHHQQAIEMSDVLLAKQGIDPKVIELATAIKAAQGPEITQMQGWLSQWGSPAMPPMEGGGHEGHDMGAGMGMMSAEQMTALKDAKGAEAARLFLTGMIAHHQGAIEMAQTEIAKGQFEPAIDMARAIAKTQQQEIDTMNGLLDAM